jgi:hypothetical protein
MMNHFNEVLNNYFHTWNQGFATKNETPIKEMMSSDFKGYWSHSGMNEALIYDYHYDIKEVLMNYDDAQKSFETLSVTERQDGEQIIVTGQETSIINNVPHKARCMFIWKRENDNWKLLREYIELER